MTASVQELPVFFHNGRPTPYRQILDDLDLHSVPEHARTAYLCSLVAFDAAPKGDDEGWEPVKGNPEHEHKRNAKGTFDYRNKKTKEPVPVAVAVGTPTAGTPEKGPSDLDRSREQHADSKGVAHAVAVGDLAEKMKQQFSASGDKAALAVIKAAPSSGSPSGFASWLGKKVSDGITGLTAWTRAFTGGYGGEKFGHDAKGWVSGAVRLVTNPLVELPKAGVHRMFSDAKRWGFTDHDSKKLEGRWGPRVANLVVASGAALGTAAAAAGLAAGLVGGGPLVAAAGAGAAVLCHYCPGFRAWIARAPAKLVLHALNKMNLIDDKKQAAGRAAVAGDKKAASNSRKAAQDAAAKKGFEAKARAAGFAEEKGKDVSDEKVLEIAKKFWEGFYKKFWKALLAEPKIAKALALVGKAHQADPASLAMAVGEMNGKAKLPEKLAEFSVDGPGRVWIDGKRVSFARICKAAYGKDSGLDANAAAHFLDGLPSV